MWKTACPSASVVLVLFTVTAAWLLRWSGFTCWVFWLFCLSCQVSRQELSGYVGCRSNYSWWLLWAGSVWLESCLNVTGSIVLIPFSSSASIFTSYSPTPFNQSVSSAQIEWFQSTKWTKTLCASRSRQRAAHFLIVLPGWNTLAAPYSCTNTNGKFFNHPLKNAVDYFN